MSVNLDAAEARAEWMSGKRKAAWRARPRVRLWNNPPDGQESRGLVLRAELRDTQSGKVSFSRRDVTTATIRLRMDNPHARWLINLPQDRDTKQGVVLSVDHMGGSLRWSGFLKEWKAVKDGFGVYYLEVTFVDDRQHLQYLMGAPNPLLPIWLIQFPRVLPGIGPAKWVCSLFILLNLIRVNNAILSLPDDPFDWESYVGIYDWSTWQVHVVCPNLLEDSSLWTIIKTRMDSLESVFEEAMDMAQLTLQYRRIFTVDGEDPTDYGLTHTSVRNGALVLEIVDNSGYYDPAGTAFGGALASGLWRSVVEFGNGFVEEYVGDAITDDHEIWPDEYYQENSWLKGWLPVPTKPNIMVRDSKWSQIETATLGYQAAGPVSVIVGGANPYVDNMAELMIQAVGNILGYIALAGFSSAGDLAATAIMPWIRGTILAWLYWKNMRRAQNIGWAHLYETRAGGGDQNAWTLSSIAALTGAFSDTKAKSVHQFTLNGAGPHYPGIDFLPGHRISSTAEQLVPGLVHVDAVEQIYLEWNYESSDDAGHKYSVTVGTGEVGKSFADRFSHLFATTLDTMSEIGLRILT